MQRSARVTWLGALAVLALVVGWRDEEPSLQRYEFARVVMGARCAMILYAPSPEVANGAASAAYLRLAQIEEALSDYMVRSETRRLPARAGERVPIGPDLAAVLRKSREHFDVSEGTFDPTVGPIIALWRHARQTGVPPTEGEIAAARRYVGFQHVNVRSASSEHEAYGHGTDLPPQKIGAGGHGTDFGVYEPTIDGVSLDFGGIGQGYGADQALQVLRSRGVTRALVDVSGDIAAGEAPPDAAGWRIEVPALETTLLLRNGALTVSGDEYQHLDSENAQGGTLRLGHIVDPRTGMALQSRTTVVVLAPRAVDADALATWLSVQGPEYGIPALRHFPGARAAWITHAQDAAGNSHPATSVTWSTKPTTSELALPRTPPAAGR